jgi:hypothetical protein
MSGDAAGTSVMKTGRQELPVISLCVGKSADAADTSVRAT